MSDSKGAGDELDKILFEWVPAGTRHRLKTAILALLAQEVNKGRFEEAKYIRNKASTWCELNKHSLVPLKRIDNWTQDRIKDLERLG